MTKRKLQNQIQLKRSVLCVGLDSDILKLPKHFSKNASGILDFNKTVINATQSFAVAYKINTAFYESLGHEGWYIMEETLKAIPQDIFTIADAKRGDIGNTSKQYAKAFFETMNFDAITLNPYLGKDTCIPFLQYKNKWVIFLALTSNVSAEKIQLIKTNKGSFLYQDIMKESATWGNKENTMYVVGATQDKHFTALRKIIPNHFILIPGIGAQGGKIKTLKNLSTANDNMNILVNVSRDILFTDISKNFETSIQRQAKKYHKELSILFS